MGEKEAKHTPVIDRIHPNHAGGIQRIYRFGNGFGASVIRSSYSYGGRSGLFELAVLKFDGESDRDYEITYDTPITSDVEGHLTDEAVDALLDRIQALEPATGAAQ
jgi:hypothetical protein